MSNETPVCPHRLDVDIAVIKRDQENTERRLETFIENINKTLSKFERSMELIVGNVESLHGHITRCRNELREEIDRDFLTKTEGEAIKGSIKAINTKLYMTGVGIVFAVSLVQIGVAFWMHEDDKRQEKVAFSQSDIKHLSTTHIPHKRPTLSR